MAWVYDERYVRAGTVVDGRDVMGNVNNIANEWNGLWDRDNVPGAVVSRSMIASNAFNDIGMVNVTTPQEFPDGSLTGWVDVDELVTTIDTRDGSIVLDAWVQLETESSGENGEAATDFVEIRLLVGETVVSESGWTSCARTKTCLSLQGYSPTGAGSSRIKVQVSVYRQDAQLGLYFSDSFIGGGQLYTGGVTAPVQITRSTIKISRGALVYRHTKR